MCVCVIHMKSATRKCIELSPASDCALAIVKRRRQDCERTAKALGGVELGATLRRALL